MKTRGVGTAVLWLCLVLVVLSGCGRETPTGTEAAPEQAETSVPTEAADQTPEVQENTEQITYENETELLNTTATSDEHPSPDALPTEVPAQPTHQEEPLIPAPGAEGPASEQQVNLPVADGEPIDPDEAEWDIS